MSRLSTRQPRQNRTKKETIDEQSNVNSPVVDEFPEKPKSINLPDVFTYLEKDEDCDSESEEEITEATITPDDPVCASPQPELPVPNTPHYSDLEVHAHEAHEDDTWRHANQHGASFHSDSGVSMGSCSPEIPLHKLRRRRSRGSTTAWPDDVNRIPVPESYDLDNSYGLLSLPNFSSPSQTWASTAPPDLNDTPEAYYTSAPHTFAQRPRYPKTPVPEGFSPAIGQDVEESLHQHGHSSEIIERNSASGYNVLASPIDSNSEELLRPIFRKFETLNNRMLLYLQDEISEIEERLLALDNTITQEDQYYGNRQTPRRSDARFPSPLQWQRNDLLARSVVKVEQYSKDITCMLYQVRILTIMKIVLWPRTAIL